MRLFSYRSLSVGLLASSLFLTGCGNTEKIKPNQTAKNPQSVAQKEQPAEACALFTQAMATDVLGETVPPSESKTIHSEEFGSTVTSCSYTTSSTDPKKIRTLTLLIRYAKDEAESKTVFEGAKAQSKDLSSVEPEAIPNIGEEAYWSAGSLNQLNVRQGNGWFIISSYLRGGDQKEMALQIAKRLFAN
jgi:hypothetical protein